MRSVEGKIIFNVLAEEEVPISSPRYYLNTSFESGKTPDKNYKRREISNSSMTEISKLMSLEINAYEITPYEIVSKETDNTPYEIVSKETDKKKLGIFGRASERGGATIIRKLEDNEMRIISSTFQNFVETE